MISNLFDVVCVFKSFLISVVAILMTPAKLVTIGLLKIKTFWDRD